MGYRRQYLVLLRMLVYLQGSVWYDTKLDLTLKVSVGSRADFSLIKEGQLSGGVMRPARGYGKESTNSKSASCVASLKKRWEPKFPR